MARAPLARAAGRSTALVLAELRRAISQGDLAPGEQIRQQLWADRIGVSRPPLREALEILTTEGLVVHGVNQGYFVTRFSRDEMQQLYTMRLLLEQEALTSLRWPDENRLAEFEEQVRGIEEHALAGRPDIAMQGLSDLYIGIYQLCGRHLIVDEIQRLWIKTTAYRSLSFDIMRDPAASGRRLRGIVELLREHDLDALRETLLHPTIRGKLGTAVPDVAHHAEGDAGRVAAS
ncbi:GntR family transcriptional regulator [Pseudonocardia dioxanivorans]|jgi:DNA-binding GntR family transcriptional regulator|uniref:GntR family transcriptional regulator n=1 Tax=Pseudonocardia dioxanivorans TaxID=240495 RepID=UPI000CCFF93D|nr:GntR family transcriptional regulator [Pseudonocardia dioxanivorans]